MRVQQSVPATLEAVSKYVEEFQKFLEQQGVTDHALIALALQELCVNIVLHSYAGQAGSIDIEGEVTSKQLNLILRDYGPNVYVPPTEIIAPDPLDLPEGGWGIYLIYQLIDTVNYKATGGVNEWHLIKRFA